MYSKLNKKTNTVIIDDELHKLCKECNTLKHKKEFAYNAKTTSKLQSKCKQCNKNYHYANKDRISKRHKIASKTTESKYIRLKSSSKKRKIPVSLTYSEYLELVNNECYYCGENLPIVGIGLDRIDSSVGYIISNCRPCCAICNIMKNTLTEVDFYSHIAKILKKSNRML